MKGLHATVSHSADQAAKAKQKVNQTAELKQYSKTKVLSFHRELVKNHSSFIFMNVLYLGCVARSAEWLSMARSPFIVAILSEILTLYLPAKHFCNRLQLFDEQPYPFFAEEHIHILLSSCGIP